jgi:hypothetical protein
MLILFSLTKALTIKSQDEPSVDEGLAVEEVEEQGKEKGEEDDEENLHTPAGTSTIGDQFDNLGVTCPWPGQTFVIRDHLTKRIITLEGGNLVLRANEISSDRASHWHCEQSKSLWLGFRNAVSGTYIGRDGNDKIAAIVKEHLQRESFCTRQLQTGEHVLLVKNLDGLLPLAYGFQDLELRVDSNGDMERPIAWEFIKVGSK